MSEPIAYVFSNSGVFCSSDGINFVVNTSLTANVSYFGNAIFVNSSVIVIGNNYINSTAWTGLANVVANTTSINFGNSTVNTFANSTTITISNSTTNSVLTSSSFTVGTTTWGNSTVNTTANSTTINIGNSTVNNTINSTACFSLTSNSTVITTPKTVIPNANGTLNLGSNTARWAVVYTSDLDLNNGIGDWTIVEGEDDLFLYNNKKNKVYKFALIEIDSSEAVPKLDSL